jgi:hypothetical protein
MFVPDQRENLETVRLKRVSADLARGLDRCRELVEDCRVKLAANSNEPGSDNDDDGESESDRA